MIVTLRALRAARARPASSPCDRCPDAESPRPAAAGSCRESDDGCLRVSGRPAACSAFDTRYESVRPPNDSPLKPSVMPKVCSNARVIARSPARPLSSSVPSMSNRISAGFFAEFFIRYSLFVIFAPNSRRGGSMSSTPRSPATSSSRVPPIALASASSAVIAISASWRDPAPRWRGRRQTRRRCRAAAPRTDARQSAASARARARAPDGRAS